MRIELPFPPSVNRIWRQWKGRTLLSREGRAYRQAVGQAWLLARQQGFGRRKVRVSVVAFMPDNRRRDIDNLWKAAGDALQACRVVEDDSQIVRLLIEHGGIDRERPRLEVTIEPAGKTGTTER